MGPHVMNAHIPPVDTRQSPGARWQGLPLDDVSIEGGFWASRQRINRDVSLAHGFRMLEQAGNLNNLRLAAGNGVGDYRGPVFMDSDVYKWLEAVGYAAPDGLPAELQAQAETAVGLVQAAQAADGYLDSYYQVAAPDRRWQELNTGHELYCAGHLMQAAVAWHRYAGDARLLEVATRVVDHIASVLGPGRRLAVPGHPEIETALVELYRHTGIRSYLELAQFFINHRGRGLLGPHPRFGGSAYYQDRVPVRESREVEGHAVRALYLATGVADVYLETGEQALLDASLRQWHDFRHRKLYITGGAGSRHNGEAFGHPYELPTERAYCETCAAIASITWNWRLLLATSDGRHADLIERTLFNGFLSGMSLTGDTFFYVNPLLSRGQSEIVGRGGVQRQPWFPVACCPPNVMRLLGTLGHYLASHDEHGVQIHQYAQSRLRARLADGGEVHLRVQTDYPWSGSVTVHVDAASGNEWSLAVRIPSWSTAAPLQVNGDAVRVETQAGYARIQRAWQAGDRLNLQLDVRARLTEPHPRVEAARGCLAVERGPLVYCLEDADQAVASVLDVSLDADAEPTGAWQPDLLGGVVTLRMRGTVVESETWGESTFRPKQRHQAAGAPLNLVAVPYYTWANRGPGSMRVWIPCLA
jgi:uncharacterized protein